MRFANIPFPDLPNIACVYRIANLKTGGFYIGSTQHLAQRWQTHYFELRANTHHNASLQCEWNEYGHQNFDVNVLEEVTEISHLKAREVFWMSKNRVLTNPLAFNDHIPHVPNDTARQETREIFAKLNLDTPKPGKEAKALLEYLSRRLNRNMSDIVEIAVLEYSRKVIFGDQDA